MSEVLGSRIVLRSGDEVFTTWDPDWMLEVEASGEFETQFMKVPLLPMDEDAERQRYRYARVRRDAVILVEPLDEREVEAHCRDREEWIAHG